MNIKTYLRTAFSIGIVALVCSSFVSDMPDARIPAPDFTLEDITGKKVSLSDFKGKVVYMDVWATWCKPCLMEIPHSKELKQKFDGNDNVVFMYVSIDQAASIPNWKAVVQKKGMSGVQLISREGTEEQLVNRYGIKGIPHFVLIDKQGKIAYREAPRPSDPQTYDLIQQLISE